MKCSLTNISLPEYNNCEYFNRLNEIGIKGIEVATSRAWPDSLHGVSQENIKHYRQLADHAGLSIVGLHSLLYGLDDLALFGDETQFYKTLEYFKLLSNVCSELGGKSLVFGSGRNKGEISYSNALDRTYKFLEFLIPSLEKDGVYICFEPLSSNDSDFINTVSESLEIVKYCSSPHVQVQLDVKAIIENNKLSEDLITESETYLKHVHVNTPGLGIVGRKYTNEHNTISSFLNGIGYDGFLTIEQIMINQNDIMTPITESFSFVNNVYK
jgi:sugar phosphate isomerase/epimerase